MIKRYGHLSESASAQVIASMNAELFADE